jgi:hypothetical protein
MKLEVCFVLNKGWLLQTHCLQFGKKACRRFWILLLAAIVCCTCQPSQVTVAKRDGPFILLSCGIVVDPGSGLMWSAKDNGQQVSFEEAEEYIHALQLAGYDDWRLPTLQELETLHVKGALNDTPPGPGCLGDYEIHRFFRLTCCCPWALEDNGTRPASFPFTPGMASGTMWHHQSGRGGNRILPVRDIETGWRLSPSNR